MRNFAEWIEETAGDEPIEAIVIGDDPRPLTKDNQEVPPELQSNLLTWTEAKPLLDYRFDAGYGSVGCHAIYAWTPTRVIAVSQYDGSVDLFTIPRNPTPCIPDMPGGGGW